MSVVQRLINREFSARRDFITGVISGPLEIVSFDGTPGGGPTVVARVNIGGARPLENVPVKSVNGSREYARLGQTVTLQKSVQGRYEVVGPSDRVLAAEVRKTYNLNSGLQVAQDTPGLTLQRVPYEYFMGPKAMKGNPAVTFNQIPAANDEITRDSGSFVDDGLEIGDNIRVAGTQDNNGVLGPLANVSALTLELAGDVLVDEGPIASGVTIGVPGTSLYNDGVTPYGLVLLVDGDGNPV